MKDEPLLPEADTVPGKTRGEIAIYSLRNEFKLLGYEATMAVSGKHPDSLDGMWGYLITDDNLKKTTEENLKKMTFPKPARVVAYELTTTSWDGKGMAPTISSDGTTAPRIGEDILQFAKHRNATKTDAWMLTNLWVAFAPFKWAEISGSEGIPWP